MVDGHATQRLRGYPAGLAVLSGGLYALAQPEQGLWFLSPICLVPLLIALRQESSRNRFLLGWLCGTFAACFVLEPVGVALAAFFGWPGVLGFAASIFLGQIFGALPLGLFSVLCGSTNRLRGASLLVPSAALVLCEWVRSNFLGGAAWGLLAYAVTPRPELAQSAAWGGSGLVTFLLVCGNVALFQLFSRRFIPAIALALGTALVVVVAATRVSKTPVGIKRVAQLPDRAEPETLRIAIVQGALPLAARRGIERARSDTQFLAEQSAVPGADLVIWSESAFSLVLPENLQLLNNALDTVGAPSALLLGAPRAAASGPPFNSALLIQNRKVTASYDKTHLVPFVETIPGPLRWLTEAAPKRRRGTQLTPIPVESHELAISICYDVLFSNVTRDQVRNGATLLVNLSNDEWFGGTRGVEQHVAAAVLRAIENRRPMLRATNTGVTTVIDRHGVERYRLPMDQPGRVLLVTDRARPRTLYTGAGDWVVWASLGFVAWSILKRR